MACEIIKIQICPFKDFVFGLQHYPNLIYSYLDIIWVAYFGKELTAKKINKKWNFSEDEMEMYELIKSAYKERDFRNFDFVKNGDKKLQEKMNSRKNL